MNIDLTEQQRQAVRNGEAIPIHAPEIGEPVMILSAARFNAMKESLEDQSEQHEVLRYSTKQAAKVTRENGEAPQSFWEWADAFRRRLASSGRSFSDSTELLREDRER